MVVFKCKMCGGELDIQPGATTAECLHCGSQQTLPQPKDDAVARLHDRANHFRRNNEFDKAMGIYEQILNEDPSDAESYWSIVLCKYGIEYVEDPRTHKRLPTVNRTQFTSIFDDDNYTSAISHADAAQRMIYEAEAKAINEIQKNILKISQQEEPFDVFICYKETDENGKRTRDSVYANDLYHELTQEGFKVFFARITLEDKLGSAYEPYIFAALNSAKVMVVIGSKPEYFNAVWVRNEWDRYLAMIKDGAKKTLIPAYSGMDPYDLPPEFSHLQAQDMTKLGFMTDLIRGIKKIIGVSEAKPQPVAAAAAPAKNKSEVDTLLRRVSIFLDNQDWTSADLYCEKVLDNDPENGQAYVSKLLARVQVSDLSKLERYSKPLDTLMDYKNAVRFADDATSEQLTAINSAIRQRLNKEEMERRERERLAQEARDRESRRARQRNELETARRNAGQHIENMLREKEVLEERKDSKNSSKQYYHQESKKLRTRAILAIIFEALFFIMGTNEASFDEGTTMLFLILHIIFAIRLHKARDKSAGVIFLDLFTLGLYTFITALVTLFKSGKKSEKELQADIQDINVRIAELDQQIETSRASIRSINEKLQQL